ncbi:hypothetical protein A1O7_05157 [Cladophialophora yegresii CBS 114405]|uniref:Uncharacterized protein n=1 Tax=Cladophialophora yegresii CBS 114405 TaxID=1182544 RepID=W9WRM9_9EURO|nr:uncharacterized protein A1O7_05157 [Cladophialophora yegresii CBS 114405]EXJ61004.1 hypothetical protein A1O7_05157 [Cladophialophora yegresii CBS 114405]
MSSKEPQSNNKSDLITKDAMYLFELMRDSPQPILLYITPYAEKTGTKANTIVKRLSEIKKRNRLNIVTTTSPPSGDTKSHTPATPRLRASNSNPRQDGQKPSVKRERKADVAKSTHHPDCNVKVEGSNHLGSSNAAHGLPSPAHSTPGTPPGKWTAANSRGATIRGSTGPGVGVDISTCQSQMPFYMPQKRAFDDFETDADADTRYVKREDGVIKKVKTETETETETWSFGGNGDAITAPNVL